MKFKEVGVKNGKTLLLLPGTGCTWEINFAMVIDDPKASYHQHFRDPDIIPFNMAHEAWLFNKDWKQPVLDAIDERMGIK